MTIDDVIARAIAHHIEHRDVELDRYQVEDLAEAIGSALATSRDVLVLEDLPEDEDEVVIVHAGALVYEGFPVGDLAASGIPKLPVWTTLEHQSSAGLVVVDCLPLARAQRLWWRLRIQVRTSAAARALSTRYWRLRRRIRTSRSGSSR